MFVDRVEIEVQGGRGGDGCRSFRREKFVPRGGPNGGDGGNGASVFVVAQEGVDSLVALAHRKHWRAGDGGHGQGSDCHGRSAEDLQIAVPPGTLVIDAEAGFILKDLVASGDRVEVARGGRGGWGNTHFKSATNRAPRQTTPGAEGERRRVLFELRVIADVGLVGLPNAGKSTLLSRLSRARPEIADYPFTTKHPILGRVSVDADRSFVMADLPGLIEGAHAGIGLGHEFLRHVERAGLLVHLVEPSPADASDPVTNYHLIRRELEQYDARLGERPEIVVVSKAELPDSDEVRTRLAEDLQTDVLAISAVTGAGLNQLVGRIAQKLSEMKSAQAPVRPQSVRPAGSVPQP
ncbi:MAG: GTPase ObgE [Pirellulales bacterium]